MLRRIPLAPISNKQAFASFTISSAAAIVLGATVAAGSKIATEANKLQKRHFNRLFDRRNQDWLEREKFHNCDSSTIASDTNLHKLHKKK